LILYYNNTEEFLYKLVVLSAWQMILFKDAFYYQN